MYLIYSLFDREYDAVEFLRFLLAGLHEDLLHSSREQPKVISSDAYDELQ